MADDDDLKKPPSQAPAPPPQPLAASMPQIAANEWDSHFCHCCGSPCTCCPGWGICGLVFCSMGSCLFGLNQKRAFGVSVNQALAWGVAFFFLSTFWGLVSLGVDYVGKLRCINATVAQAQASGYSEQETADALVRCLGTASNGSVAVSVISAIAGLALIGVGAWRRMMLRERFGIRGSAITDFCTWFWCSPCALCQETRTLELRGVREGVWGGGGGALAPPPLPPGAVPAHAAATPPLAAPAKEEMSKIV